ncbi:hypothetical protein OPT61_g7358 [Boeremia exigua]|uniref:Uncharacterized protein n=1 Tax=Boeremia exigua TaxID=749465 RepID=A0ACC2I3K0_9PLEO|nr:hypothetical protein OPT61_g7358 [Boeremia exigua]
MSAAPSIQPKFLPSRQDVGVVAVGFSGGQPKAGVDAAPMALIEAGLIKELEGDLDLKVTFDGQVHNYAEMLPADDPDYRGMKRPKFVSAVTKEVSDQVYNYAKDGKLVLTLGGDHSIAMGTVSGTAKAVRERLGREIAVIWVDAHADINTPETSDSGNIHGMPVAFLTGLAKEDREDCFGWLKPEHMLSTKKLVYIGLRDIDRGEKKILREHGIKAFSMHDVDRHGIGKVMDMALAWIGSDTPIHLSFDIDALDPMWAPSTGTAVRGGLTLREGDFIAECVAETGSLIALDLVEVNPSLDEVGASDTIRAGNSIIRCALGDTLLRVADAEAPARRMLPEDADMRHCYFRSHPNRLSYATARPQLGSLTATHLSRQRRSITISQLESRRDNRERVVILGSGWAGFTVARQLDAKKYQTVVVSPRSYFAFTPLLASTAVGTLEFRTAVEPVRSRRTKVDFVQGWADDVDFKNKTLTIEQAVDDPTQGLALTQDRHEGETKEERAIERESEIEKGNTFDLTYDKLVVTVGCYSQTFNTPGVREHAFFLKDVGDARKIRNRLLACFEAAALPTTPENMKKELLNFAVVGGGPTGIEFSAELHDLIKEDMARIYPELIKYHKITVYDVAEKVLPMFDEKLAGYAMDKFKREGIDIKTKHHVVELSRGSPLERSKLSSEKDYRLFTLNIKEEGELGVAMCVWSTGLMQNPFVHQALSNVRAVPDNLRLVESVGDPSFAKDVAWKVKKDERSGSILTDDRLRLKVVPQGKNDKHVAAVVDDVYVLGDCGIIEGTTYPATAQVASQKGLWLAKRLNKQDLDKAGFKFRDLGTLAYIGNWDALLQGGKWGRLQGYIAWVIWRGAYLTRTVSWRNKILVPVYWAVNWLFGRDISRF